VEKILIDVSTRNCVFFCYSHFTIKMPKRKSSSEKSATSKRQRFSIEGKSFLAQNPKEAAFEFLLSKAHAKKPKVRKPRRIVVRSSKGDRVTLQGEFVPTKDEFVVRSGRKRVNLGKIRPTVRKLQQVARGEAKAVHKKVSKKLAEERGAKKKKVQDTVQRGIELFEETLQGSLDPRKLQKLKERLEKMKESNAFLRAQESNPELRRRPGAKAPRQSLLP